MPLSKHDANKIHELLCEIWDRGPSQERLGQLEAFARLHGDLACDEIITFTSLHSELASSASSARAFEASVAAVLGDQTAEKLGGTVVAKTRKQHVRAGRRQSGQSSARQKLAWLAVSAAVLLAAGWGLGWGSAQHDSDHDSDNAEPTVAQLKLFRPPQPVASVIEDSVASWSALHGVGADKTLVQGQLLELESGSAQISMACGADIILQAPCTVKLVADDLVELHSGKVTAQAATWATGFVIETKGLRVTDLGTRFAVSADASGVTEAHVMEGSVLAEPMKDIRPKRSSMLLKQGEAIRVSLPQSTIDLIAAKGTDFIDHLPTFRPLRPIRISNTGLGGVAGQNDLHWTVVAGSQSNEPFPRPAIISPGDPVYLDNMPDASQWISVNSDSLAAPDSVHTFETHFDLTGYDINTVCMVGLFLVDDAINRLSINGNDIPFERWSSSWDVQDFKRFRAIVIDKGFVPGENTILIDVYNSPNKRSDTIVPNPVGLRVEWQAFGCEAP